MNKIFVILIFVIGGYFMYTSGDGTEPKIDVDLITFVDKWKSDMGDIDYSAGFNRIDSIYIVDDNKAGHFDKNSGIIYISKNRFDEGYYSVKATLYHELGHYVFNLQHDNSTSIMHATTYKDSVYKEHWDSLLNIYIKKCKSHEWEGRF